jgi:hypothetical protein
VDRLAQPWPDQQLSIPRLRGLKNCHFTVLFAPEDDLLTYIATASNFVNVIGSAVGLNRAIAELTEVLVRLLNRTKLQPAFPGAIVFPG